MATSSAAGSAPRCSYACNSCPRSRPPGRRRPSRARHLESRSWEAPNCWRTPASEIPRRERPHPRGITSSPWQRRCQYSNSTAICTKGRRRCHSPPQEQRWHPPRPAKQYIRRAESAATSGPPCREADRPSSRVVVYSEQSYKRISTTTRRGDGRQTHRFIMVSTFICSTEPAGGRKGLWSELP